MLRVEQLCLRVGGFQLRDVCMQIRPREYFVLMGPTGSGKSLLAKSVCGIIRVGAGSIHIDGKTVTDLEPRFRHVGYVPQESALFPHLTVVRNITFGLRAAGVGRREAARRIDPLVEALGIRHLLARSTVNLSGGETQKVALARALARDPKLLVLDEPVSALDEPTRREICRVLRRVQREVAVATLHVCHSLEEARLVGDRVGIMSDGRLVQTGTLKELTRSPADPAVRRLLFLDNRV
jgi:ABC-type sugar transport system ATPase subunit